MKVLKTFGMSVLVALTVQSHAFATYNQGQAETSAFPSAHNQVLSDLDSAESSEVTMSATVMCGPCIVFYLDGARFGFQVCRTIDSKGRVVAKWEQAC